MTKELASIQDLKSAFITYCKTLGCEDNYIKVCENKFSDIEKALKELQERREMMKRFNEACVPMILDNRAEKEVKAFETIKEKSVDIQTLKRTNSVIEYNSCVAKGLGEKELTQEEYDFLKEMLS